LTVTGTTAATTDVDDKSITLDQLASTGAVTVTTQGTAAHVTIDNTTTDLSVQGSVAGDLEVTASAGGISDSALLSATGNITVIDTANAGITLDTLAADGNVIVTGGNTVIVNDTALAIQGSISGTLSATATTGAISDSGNLVVSGLGTLNAGTNAVTLGDSETTTFGSLNVTGGAVSANLASGTDLAGVSASSLNLTTAGDITDSGNINVSGAATFNSGTNVITLGDATGEMTAFDSLTITGGAVAITEDGATTLSSANVGSLALNSSSTVALGSVTSTGDLSVTSGIQSGTAITDSGNLAIAGTASFSAGDNSIITLGDADGEETNFGSLSLTGGTVTVTEDSATDLAAGSITSLSLNSAGNITDSGALVVSNDADSSNLEAKITTSNGYISLSDLELKENAGVDLGATTDVIVAAKGQLAGKVTGTNLVASSTAGIAVDTVVNSLTATTDSEGINIANTGGLTITSAGVTAKGTKANDITITAKSPITVNGPIQNATSGKIILVAEGATASDDITINNTLTALTVDLYAGDSIIINDNGAIDLSVANSSSVGTATLNYGTNFANQTVAKGLASAGVIISDSANIAAITDYVIVGEKVMSLDGTDDSLLFTTSDRSQDFYNALDPSAEVSSTWNFGDSGNVIVDSFVDQPMSDEGSIEIGEIEEEEKK